MVADISSQSREAVVHSVIVPHPGDQVLVGFWSFLQGPRLQTTEHIDLSRHEIIDFSRHMLPNEVFLSYSDKDRGFAASIVEVLRHRGIPVWYSRTNILGAQQWHDEIGAALQRCDWFVVILSPNSVESVWVKRELLYALQQNRFENRIIPLLYQPCDSDRLSWTLSFFQMIDFTGPSDDDGFRQLLRTWGIGY